MGEPAARHLKPAVLVLADAGVGYAVGAVTFSVFMNAGQIRMSGDRILVRDGHGGRR